MGQQSDLQDAVWFLTDGLLETDPLVILQADPRLARELALRIHGDGCGFLDAASKGARLVALDADRVLASTGAEPDTLMTEAVDSGTWLFVEEVQQYLDTGPGMAFLRMLFDRVLEARAPVVLLTTDEFGLERLAKRAPRLLALGTVFSPDPPGWTHTNTLVKQADDLTDTGWTVLVAYGLTGPLDLDGTPPDPGRFEAALNLVDRIQLIDREPSPLGVLVSFHAPAFSVSQQNAAFEAAEAVARRVAGRALGPEETVEARRGIYSS